MPKLYVMVALPRAGKSSYVSTHFRDTVKVSADQLRLLIHGKRFHKKGEPMVWHFRGIMLKALMEQGLDVVVDETNVTREKRKPLIQLSQKYGYSVVAIVIATGKEICMQRAVETNQGDLIPVIEEMSRSYEDVSAEEGFDEIIRAGL